MQWPSLDVHTPHKPFGSAEAARVPDKLATLSVPGPDSRGGAGARQRPFRPFTDSEIRAKIRGIMDEPGPGLAEALTEAMDLTPDALDPPLAGDGGGSPAGWGTAAPGSGAMTAGAGLDRAGDGRAAFARSSARKAAGASRQPGFRGRCKFEERRRRKPFG